jgi:LysM repeat protein
MKNIFKSIKESNGWKWLNYNGKYYIGSFLAIILAIVVLNIAFTRSKANVKINNSLVKISTISKAQVTTIESLSVENSVLKEKVKKLKAKKVQEKDNIKNYILTYYRTVAPIIAEETAIHIIEKSNAHNVPFVAVVAVTEVESHFNPFAISKKGARGSMQVMPRYWVKEFKLPNKYALHDIETNIDCGVRVLRQYLDDTDNNMRKALYKYVGGDHAYIKRVYESMGKFIVFKSFTDIKVTEEENATSITDNDKIEAGLGSTKNVIVKINNNIMFTHIVKKGQTLGLLAKHYTGSLSNWPKISAANSTIIPEKMPIGSVIIIPTNLLKNNTPLT